MFSQVHALELRRRAYLYLTSGVLAPLRAYVGASAPGQGAAGLRAASDRHAAPTEPRPSDPRSTASPCPVPVPFE